MSSPPGAGMGGGLGQGGGMHGPAVRPHHPPSQSQAIVPAGPPHQQPDNVLSLQPIMSAPPPLSIGMPTTQVVRPAGSGGEQPLKRKRGRPRKYETGAASSPGVPGGAYPVLPALMPASSSPYTPGSEKRGRGRPPGSGKKAQLAALGEQKFPFLVLNECLSFCLPLARYARQLDFSLILISLSLWQGLYSQAQGRALRRTY